jgi:hypothetical protein
MRISVLGCFAILLACQADVSWAQSPAEQPVNKALECNASLPNRPELSLLAGKVSVSGEPKDSLEMQANPAKPTALEKAAIAKWATMRDGCFELGSAWMDAIQAKPWFRAIVLEAKDSSDAMVSALYRGELTYGAFNVKHMALAAEIRRRVNEGVATARREEASVTPAAAPAVVANAPAERNPAADRSQCDMDSARAYPVLMQQRMTDPGFQAPGQPRAQQSNCTVLGGQVNCRTAPTGVDTSIYNRPPSYVTEDVNQMRRQAAFGACMEAKGYRRN